MYTVIKIWIAAAIFSAIAYCWFAKTGRIFFDKIEDEPETEPPEKPDADAWQKIAKARQKQLNEALELLEDSRICLQNLFLRQRICNFLARMKR